MSSYITISSDKLSRLIGTANAPTLIDVRIDNDFAADLRLIPGAGRRSHRNVQDRTGGLADQSDVVICQKRPKAQRRYGGLATPQQQRCRNAKGGRLVGRKRSCRPFPPTGIQSGTRATRNWPTNKVKP
jgi:hypothetical protein